MRFTQSYENLYVSKPVLRKSELKASLTADIKQTLGSNKKLTSAEMDQLRLKLAEASAYDHTSIDKIVERKQKITRKPHFYRKATDVSSIMEDMRLQRSNGKRTKQIIHIEQEKLKMLVPVIPHTRCISEKSKITLQDAYQVQPRKISTVSSGLMDERLEQELEKADMKISKRRAGPAAIPQVFLM